MVSTLKYCAEQIVLQEIPGEVCLSFLVSGCALGCAGCHSVDSWDAEHGFLLDLSVLKVKISQYQNFLTCVLFMGGEWAPNALKSLLECARGLGLKTALYTGLDDCPVELLPYLDFIKTGRWIKELGGLAQPQTNQRLIDLQHGLCLNPLFWEPQQAAFAVQTPAISRNATILTTR